MPKNVVLTAFGGYDVLKIQEMPKPTPSKGEVLINIHASGINFAELMLRQGTYGSKSPKLPAVIGSEGAGVVVELGKEVETLKIGDRVICMRGTHGLWAEYSNVPAAHCFRMPEEMTFEEGAAIPINYVTAYHMLFDFGNLRKGKKVLVHMAAGGVGIAATQLCKSVPDVTVFGTASAHKHDEIKKVGVDYPIDYRTKDYAEEIRKISPGVLGFALCDLIQNACYLKDLEYEETLIRLRITFLKLRRKGGGMIEVYKIMTGKRKMFEEYFFSINRNLQRVDIVLDPLSGPDSVKGYGLLRPLGKIIHFGAANAVTGPSRNLWQLFKTYWATKNYSPLTMLTQNKAACGYHMGYLDKTPEVIQEAVQELLILYKEGKIKPRIDSVWALEDVGKAMARMHDRLNIGKVILSPQKAPVKE